MPVLRGPTVAVLWAHDNPLWSGEQRQAWQATVLELVTVLRKCGVDADVDLFHGSEPTDWARFGPAAIRTRDYVVVAVSATWKRAWEGALDPGESAGALAEANELHGLFAADAAAFLRRVVPVLLPGTSTADLPQQLRATTNWFEVAQLDRDGIEDLLRRLTTQPAYPKRALGAVPLLPPRRHARAVAPPALTPIAGPAAFTLQLPRGPLSGRLTNAGGTSARIEDAVLVTATGSFDGHVDVAELPVDGRVTLSFAHDGIAALAGATGRLGLRVRYRAAERAELFEYRLQLARADSERSGEPCWTGRHPATVIVG
jgi:hypothetical protein